MNHFLPVRPTEVWRNTFFNCWQCEWEEFQTAPERWAPKSSRTIFLYGLKQSSSMAWDNLPLRFGNAAKEWTQGNNWTGAQKTHTCVPGYRQAEDGDEKEQTGGRRWNLCGCGTCDGVPCGMLPLCGFKPGSQSLFTVKHVTTGMLNFPHEFLQ